jgi:hypothetical protein
MERKEIHQYRILWGKPGGNNPPRRPRRELYLYWPIIAREILLGTENG